MPTITVTNKNAIYVDGTRITDRETKWGVHHTIDEWVGTDVVGECMTRGHERAVSRIDDAAYIAAAKAALAAAQ